MSGLGWPQSPGKHRYISQAVADRVEETGAEDLQAWVENNYQTPLFQLVILDLQGRGREDLAKNLLDMKANQTKAGVSAPTTGERFTAGPQPKF